MYIKHLALRYISILELMNLSQRVEKQLSEISQRKEDETKEESEFQVSRKTETCVSNISYFRNVMELELSLKFVQVSGKS